MKKQTNAVDYDSKSQHDFDVPLNKLLYKELSPFTYSSEPFFGKNENHTGISWISTTQSLRCEGVGAMSEIKELSESLREVLDEKDEILTDVVDFIDDEEDLALQLWKKTRECQTLQEENKSLLFKIDELCAELESVLTYGEFDKRDGLSSDWTTRTPSRGSDSNYSQQIDGEGKAINLIQKYQHEAQLAHEIAFSALQENRILKKIMRDCSSCHTTYDGEETKCASPFRKSAPFLSDFLDDVQQNYIALPDIPLKQKSRLNSVATSREMTKRNLIFQDKMVLEDSELFEDIADANADLQEFENSKMCVEIELERYHSNRLNDNSSTDSCSTHSFDNSQMEMQSETNTERTCYHCCGCVCRSRSDCLNQTCASPEATRMWQTDLSSDNTQHAQVPKKGGIFMKRRERRQLASQVLTTVSQKVGQRVSRSRYGQYRKGKLGRSQRSTASVQSADTQ